MTEARRDPGVVAGVDGSEASRRALEWAAREARWRGVPLRVVHAFPGDVAVSAAEDAAVLRDAAERLLTQATDHARELMQGSEVVQALLEGPPAKAFVEEAETASLLVVGSRGHGGFSSLLLGSTSVNVAAHATCPVVVVPSPETTAPPSAEAGAVVVGTDTSSKADPALEFAFARAQDRGIAVVALYAWQLPVSYSAYAARELLRTDSSKAEHDARARLADAVAAWQDRYPAVDVEHRAVVGHPVGALVEASAEAEVMVVGSRGRGTLAGMMLGSVSQGLLRHAQSPVVVAR